MAIDLTKRVETFTLSLKKRNISRVNVRVGCAFDVSGSMQNEYQEGLMTELAARLVPLALKFDDNGELDNWAFHHDVTATGTITRDNYARFVQDKVQPLVGGGTNFAPVLTAIEQHYFTGKKPGLLGKLFGASQVRPEGAERPVYIILQTDGDNTDPRETEAVLQRLSAHPVYIQFLGVGTDTDFKFIRKMGDKFPQVGFLAIPDLRKISDEQLYDGLLNPEFLGYMRKNHPSSLQEN